jgi:hypothetical protein
MFAPEVLGPTVDRLAELAGKGPALEFAIGTGRVAVPLAQRGVPVMHLAPSGRFVLENGAPGLRELLPGQHAVVWKSEPGYIGLDTYDVLHQHLVSYHVTFSTGQEARMWRSPHRYIWPSVLDLMAQLAGFELEARHADWAGPSSPPSPSLMFRSTGSRRCPRT